MKKLLFVYNAKSGKINATVDFFHKALSPETYECNLCNITYGIFSERTKWRKYRERSGVEMKFYYKDEFENAFDLKVEYPVIIKSPEMEILINKSEINQLNTLDQLIEAIDQKLIQ